MASRDYRSDIAEEINKIRRDRGSNVSYSVRKYREQRPNPYRDGASNSSRRTPIYW